MSELIILASLYVVTFYRNLLQTGRQREKESSIIVRLIIDDRLIIEYSD